MKSEGFDPSFKEMSSFDLVYETLQTAKLLLHPPMILAFGNVILL